MTHHELQQTTLNRPEVKAAYEALGPALVLLHQMVKARGEAGLTECRWPSVWGQNSLESTRHKPHAADA